MSNMYQRNLGLNYPTVCSSPSYASTNVTYQFAQIQKKNQLKVTNLKKDVMSLFIAL